MLKGQNYRCKACGKPFKNDGDRCVDHCHRTNKVRSILCKPCNLSLGCMQENVSAILGLAKYAEEFCAGSSNDT